MVAVKWLDSSSLDNWASLGTANNPATVYTLGYLTSQNDEYLDLASSIDDQGQGCHRTCILKANILSQHLLRRSSRASNSKGQENTKSHEKAVRL